MARYIDADKLAEMARAKADTLIHGKQAFNCVANWLDLLPAADVVEVETTRAWLSEIALNNVDICGDFSELCMELITRLPGLRRFAQERNDK